MRLITFLAGRYVAGDTWHDEFRAIKKLNAAGISAICDYLGENVLKPKKAQHALKIYLHLLEAIHYHKLDANISIKLTQLGLDIDLEFAELNLRMLLEKAKEVGNFVWLDMESSAYTDRTIAIYKKFIHKYGSHLGICIQTYLRRSENDIKELLPLHPSIRLVKGAYKESPQVAFPLKQDVDANYRKLAKVLISAKPRMAAIATHDEKIIKDIVLASQTFVHRRKPSVCIEFEMLYGIRPDLQKKLVKEGLKVRIYTPFGRQWLPYFYRRLRERKENIFFVIKNLFRR